mgnify:CR=1 FL=1
MKTLLEVLDACSTEVAGLLTDIEYSRIRDGMWALPYAIIINYSDTSRASQNRRKLPE